MTFSRRLVAVAFAISVLQMGLLTWMIAGRAALLRTGSEVTLDVEPVDPRDLLRGDYVTLNYAISTLSRDMVDARAVEGDDIYVLLRPATDAAYRAEAAAIGAMPGEVGDDVVVIRGIVDHVGEDVVRVVYGIERYYVPEGEGRVIEDAMRVDHFKVVAAVGEDGSAQIKRLLQGGAALYQEPIY